jgi:hypothetical protein
MEAMVSRRAVAATLSLLFAVPVGAATLGSPGFETCRAQKECRRLNQAELDRLRGGLSFMSAMGPVEITFGITQAVYINNQLVALTRLVGPGAGQTIGTLTPSSTQAQALNAALQGATVTPLPTSGGASVPSGASPSTSQSILPAAATNPAASASQAATRPAQATGLNATLNTPTNTGSPAQPTAGSVATVGSSPAVPAGPAAPTVLVNGSAVKPGSPVINVPTAAGLRTLVIQNGPGNFSVPSAADIRAGMMGTLIQSTLDGQKIRSETEMNVTLGLSRAMRASSIRDSVRQGMVNSRP